MTLNFTNGGFATIQSSWLEPRKVRQMTIVGSRRMIVYDDLEPTEKVKVYAKGITVESSREAIYKALIQYRIGDMTAPAIDNVEAP